MLLNILTWLASGRTSLLERGLADIWENSAVPAYQEQYDALVVFASDPPYPMSLRRSDGEVVKVRDFDSDQLYTTFLGLETPMIAMYTTTNYWNPFIVHATTGYWLVGSDHLEKHDEWLIWVIAFWVPLSKSGAFRRDTF